MVSYASPALIEVFLRQQMRQADADARNQVPWYMRPPGMNERPGPYERPGPVGVGRPAGEAPPVPQMSPYDRYMSRFRSGAQVGPPGPNASAEENQAYLDAQRDFRSQSRSRFAADQPRSLAENMALTPDLSGARSPIQPSSDPFGSMFPKSLMLMRSMLSGIGSFGGGYSPYMGNQYSGMGYMGGGGYGSYMGGPYAGMGYSPYMGGGGYNPYMGGGGYNPYMGGGYNPYMGGGGYSPNMGMLSGLGSMFGGYGSFSGSGGSPYSSPVSA